MTGRAGMLAVKGSLDAEGRLVEADPPLADLHRRAGGREGGSLAVPQVAALARLARRLGITVSRGAIAADGDRDVELWVRAEPAAEGVNLSIGGWNERPAHRPVIASPQREADFARAAADWAWETDEGLRLTMLSLGAATDLVGQQLTSLFRFREHEDGSLPILNALAERQRFENQLAELRSSGELYRIAGVPLIDGAGRFAGFRGSASAVAEGEETPAEPPHDPSVFGGRVDKALRDPLDHIINHAEALSAQPDGPLQTDYAGYAADIASAGRHLLTLIDDLVDLQAVERPDFAPASDSIDLAHVARQASGLLGMRASDRQVRIEEPGVEATLPATGEYRRALQVLMNLVTNAIRYSPDGGAVRITAERRGEFAYVCVSDEGKGIAQEDLERIFDKFERVDPLEQGGTGLGLYIARRLARAMGGDLVCQSALGKGACFTFTLPARS
jgi:signal transduction histidine kinase